jgi:phage terminase small subunit
VIEIAEGRPGRRPINGREPQPRAKTPKCPDYLDVRAKEEWRRLVPILKRMQVLTEADYLRWGIFVSLSARSCVPRPS